MVRACPSSRLATVSALLIALSLTACGDRARLSVAQGIGPNPQLPPPVETLLPTVKIAEAVGWPAGAAPSPAPGLAVTPFAQGLDHPRWLYVLPNGDVLVAETNTPPRPDDGKGLKAAFMRMYMEKAGAAVPSANRITLLRDADGDGVAELKTPFLTGLHSPFGMALVGDTLYIANSDAVVSVPYGAGATRIDATPRAVAP